MDSVTESGNVPSLVTAAPLCRDARRSWSWFFFVFSGWLLAPLSRNLFVNGTPRLKLKEKGQNCAAKILTAYYALLAIATVLAVVVIDWQLDWTRILGGIL